MNLIRTNDKEKLHTSEEIYWSTIQGKYIQKPIGEYQIKRNKRWLEIRRRKKRL